jgi:hypothetical protein
VRTSEEFPIPDGDHSGIGNPSLVAAEGRVRKSQSPMERKRDNAAGANTVRRRLVGSGFVFRFSLTGNPMPIKGGKLRWDRGDPGAIRGGLAG